MKKSVQVGILTALLASAPQAQAGTKEELIRLQSDVLALQNQIRSMEKAFVEQTEGLRSLVAQLNDQVGKSNLILGRISTTIETQASGDKVGNQAILQEIRSLAGKIDDTSTRVSALAQQVNDLKVQSKAMTTRTYQSDDPATIAMSADTIYNEAFNDLVQGKFDLAIEGFTSFIRNFPSNERADDAQYNIGECYYNSNRMPQAVSAFTRVLNEYPSGEKVASALFKRAKAELAMQESENAIQDFRAVVQKYPNAPEAALAKTELERLGAGLSRPARPAVTPGKRRP